MILKIRYFDLNQIFIFFSQIRIFMPRFYQIFETGLSAQSHKNMAATLLLFPVILLLSKK